MTDFIDFTNQYYFEYWQIASGINNIQILNDVQSINNRTQKAKKYLQFSLAFQTLIKEKYKSLNLTVIYNYLNHESHQDQICDSQNPHIIKYALPMVKFNSNISILPMLIINQQLNLIKIQSQLLKNNIPLIVKSKFYKNLLNRYFNKLNSSIKYGYFKINNFSGQIFLNLCSIYTLIQFQQININPNKGLLYIESELSTSIKYLHYNLHKILFLMGEMPNNTIKLLESKKQKNITLSEEKISHRKIDIQFQNLYLMSRYTNLSTYQFDFQYSAFLKKPIKKQNQIQTLLAESREKYIQDMAQLLDQTQDIKFSLQKHNLIMKDNSYLVTCKKTYQQVVNELKEKDRQKINIKYLMFPIARVSNQQNDNTHILSQIYVYNPKNIQWQAIGEGGFSKIERGRLNFNYNNNIVCNQKKSAAIEYLNFEKIPQSQRLTKYFALKTQKTVNPKIPHQKKILEAIRDQSCVHIAKFYYSQQEEFKNSLLMDFYISKSLQFYKKYNELTFSLVNRLYILCQVVQGIRFLRDYRIVHFDIKPQNSLIGKGLLLRLTDFGEAYYSKVCNKQFRPGFTVPYVTPQIFENKIEFSEKLDVFSLGVLMHELLFDYFPIQFRRFSSQKLLEFYKIKKQSNMTSQSCPEKVKQYGPVFLMQILCILCLKCINHDKKQRPFLDWILIVLRQSINYLDRLY